MKISNIELHTKAAKQSCDVCGHQLSQQKKSDKQRKIVHEGAKYAGRQCSYRNTIDISSFEFLSLPQHKTTPTQPQKCSWVEYENDSAHRNYQTNNQNHDT